MSVKDTDVVIVAAKRTVVGSFGGSFKNTPAVELGAAVVKNILAETKLDPAKVDSVIMGNVLQSGLGQNPARQVALKAGLPCESTALTINKVCGSGLKTVMLATQSLLLGDEKIVIAGGIENMSLAPYALDSARFGYRLGDGKLKDTLVYDGLTCAFNQYHMGITAENVAEKYNISREEQDEFSLQSQQKAAKGIADGCFKNEIVPVIIPNKKGDITVDTDEFVKPNASMEGLAKLKPAFKKDGTVTAGNASGINDGAAAVLMMTAATAKELGLKPMAKVVSYGVGGVDPSVMGLGPVPAIKKALAKADLSIDDIEIMELNEAFAAQSLGVIKELQLDQSKINLTGGAIAIGHPIGASGTRILVTLLHAMKRLNKKTGLAGLCIGGGQGAAIIVENID